MTTPIRNESGGDPGESKPAAAPALVPRSGREVLAAWTDDQRAHLRSWFGLRDELYLARELGCDVAELHAAAWEAFDEPVRDDAWSAEETAEFRKYLGAVDLDLIARMLGRSRFDLDRRLVELAASLGREPLSADEIVSFKRLYGTRADEDLALVFGRELALVQETAAKLCLSKDKVFLRRASGGSRKTLMPRWSSDELEKLAEMYPSHSNLDIAQVLGRSVKSVVSKAHNLGLKKDKARLQQMGRQNVRMRYER
ncbi:MAG: hypothetical protein VX460_15250 [Planctomycetota bacterium]|nr:hypothetical protein [Planctomycetota bacterium]